MWYDEMFEVIEHEGTEEEAVKMAAYMQNLFPFRGIKKPYLKILVQPYLKKVKKDPMDWEFMRVCWEKDYREAQYVGVIYICQHDKELTGQDIEQIKQLIVQKSWWETVDQLDAVIGNIVLKEPEYKKLMLEWSVDENLWLRRLSIDFQQEYNEQTDKELLETIICNNLGSSEFFINKAIGWSLRDYSHTNPEWVRNFLKKYGEQMATLSKKEATKYL